MTTTTEITDIGDLLDLTDLCGDYADDFDVEAANRDYAEAVAALAPPGITVTRGGPVYAEIGPAADTARDLDWAELVNRVDATEILTRHARPQHGPITVVELAEDNAGGLYLRANQGPWWTSPAIGDTSSFGEDAAGLAAGTWKLSDDMNVCTGLDFIRNVEPVRLVAIWENGTLTLTDEQRGAAANNYLATHAAVLTRINNCWGSGPDAQDNIRSWDTLTIVPVGDLHTPSQVEDAELITVESDEDEAPYLAAIEAAGWTVVDRNGPPAGIIGADAILCIRN